MSDHSVRNELAMSQTDFEREIDRILAEIERLDESIVRHQEETKRSRERTAAILTRLTGVK
jgi:peptidoglycan hydrolase CwlO-like protein